MVARPSETEVTATTIGPFDTYDGWYCPNHPPGDSLANDQTRTRCWGCGVGRPSPEVEKTARAAMTPVVVVRLPSEPAS